MCVTPGKDGCKAVAQSIKDDIDWESPVCFGLDNTNNNMGNKNCIKSRILKKNHGYFMAGCNCHLSHLAAGNGGFAYYGECGFDCEDHQVDVYYIIVCL